MSTASTLRFSAFAVLLATTALAAPSFAHASNASKAAPTIVAAADPSDAADQSDSKMMKGKDTAFSPEMMKEHVEQRIQTLHTKLNITPDQEEAWNGVAQAMRDNENNIGTLIEQRHNNVANATAVEDLQSYQAIAQAHADGLKNVVAAFQPLYDSMSDDQKKNADTVFGTFEGHHPGMQGKAHKSSKKM